MKKTKKYMAAAGLTAVFLSAGLVAINALPTVLAQSNSQALAPLSSDSGKAGTGWLQHGRGMKKGMFIGNNIQRNVQNIDNGVQITLTSTDMATVTKLQAMKQPTPPDTNVTATQSNISNGIQITITSTDADTVKKIQSHEMMGKGGMMGLGMLQNVQRTVTNVDNGIQMTITSTDAATVTKLQSRKQPTFPNNSNVTVTQTNISNGVQITITSTDAATVTRLQNGPKDGQGFHFGPRFGGKGGNGLGGLGQNVERTVTNVDNGIQMTITSTDPATVTKLQSRKQPAFRNDSNVTVTQTNISNGIQITITSTDAATVTKLQQRQQNNWKFGHNAQ